MIRLGISLTASSSALAGPIDPLELNPYLYFDGSENVTTAGGAVSSWSERSAGSNQLDRTLAQTTAGYQPDNAGELAIKFDGSDDRLAFDVAVAQAGILIVATSNGIFAYEVDADSIDEITALGHERSLFKDLDLYAYVLLPASVTDSQIGRVVKWLDANTGATKNPTGSLSQYWQDRTDLVAPKFDALDFSSVTSLQNGWVNDISLTSFPALDISSVTTLTYTWYSCTSLTSFGVCTFSTDASDDIDFSSAWRYCTALATVPALNLSRGTNFTSAWQTCTSLTSFLATGLDSGTNFTYAWSACTSLATFPAIPLTAGTNFTTAWYNCTSLTTFLATGLDSGTNFTSAWAACTSLATFPAIPLTAGTNFSTAWYNCTSLTSFLATGLDSGTNFQQAWRGCTSLTSFPALDLSSGTNFQYGWKSCTAMTSFNATDLDSGLYFTEAWMSCTALTTFPALVLTAGVLFNNAWYGCTSMTSFLATGLDSGTGFGTTWANCTALTSFPAIPLNAGTSFNQTWANCTSMVSFNATGMNAGAYFYYAWNGCSALTTFPAGVFDDWNPASITANCFLEAWGGCADLTEQSVQNILHSIAASGQSAPSSGKEITIDSNNVDVNDLNATIRASCAALQSRGWEVVINGSVVDEYSINFNGTDEYVDTNFQPDFINTNATMSYWCKMDNFTGDQTMGCHNSKRFYAGFNSSSAYFGVQDAYMSGTDLSSYIAVGKWHHICLVADGGTATYYLDGVSRDTKSYTQASGSNPDTNFFIGAWSNAGAGNFMEGKIDEVAIWDVALDADAVTAVYNAGQPINLSEAEGNYDNEGDLVSWWRMGDNDSGAGTTVTDQAGSNDGTLVNTPTFVVDTPPNYSNYALNFNGTDEYADCGDIAAMDGASALTISAWIKRDVSNGMVTIQKDLDVNNRMGINVYDDGNIYVSLAEGAAYSGGSFACNDTSWHHVVMVFDGSGTGNAGRLKGYLDGIEQTLSFSGTVPAATDDNSASFIIGHDVTNNKWTDGTVDEVAFWTSVLTSAQINTIFNGGAPADLDSLSPLGWWRMGENNAGTGSTITDQGSGGNNATLVNSPTFVRTTPIENAVYNYRSIGFNGTDEYGTSSADDTLATKSYSWWAKSTETSSYGAFDHGAGSVGALLMNQANYPWLFLSAAANYWVRWDDTAAQDDGNWHHWVCYIEHDDVTNCKLYCDGALQSINASNTAGSADAYISGIRIGLFGTAYFDGNMDEFAIFDGELSAAQIVAIYNGGVPFDISEFNPESWWRMGEGDAEGTIISDLGLRTGSELVINGTFDTNADGWTADYDCTLSADAGRLKMVNSASHALCIARQAVTVEVGASYEVSAELIPSAGTATELKFLLGTSTYGSQYYDSGAVTADTTITRYITATATGLYLDLRNLGPASATAYFSNISVKRVGGNPLTLVNTPTWSTDSP